ncbi:tRNA (guanosine(37)-N1)-methyltransferase TrmD [Luminiphilus sp.]|nr:tRNA (guanosine(37)-N1)-methyltransferase TrmD [Luminiphilus sp.]
MTDRVALNAFALVSIFPEMASTITQWGVTGRAARDGRFRLETVNPRDFASDKHGTVDDRPYGGGPGMVMKAPTMTAAVDEARHRLGSKAVVIAMSPQGQLVNEQILKTLLQHEALIFVAGRYEGFDERFISKEVDLELSIGDIVVSGGEIPAMLVMDSLIRRIPGVLGDELSAEQDSFVDGLLDCPHYTRPENYEGMAVPPVLMSGDHARIADWRSAQSLRRTLDRRPDLITRSALTVEQQALLRRWDLFPSDEGA